MAVKEQRFLRRLFFMRRNLVKPREYAIMGKNAALRRESGETPSMDQSPALWEARAMLENLTPLKSDCGKRCGHACCQSPAGEERGMLLFPGEAEYYRDREGYRAGALRPGNAADLPGDAAGGRSGR